MGPHTGTTPEKAKHFVIYIIQLILKVLKKAKSSLTDIQAVL